MDRYKTLVGAIQTNAFSNKCGNICFINSNDEEDYISYKELYNNALAILYKLQLSGIEPGDELVFQIEDNKTMVCTFWACMLGKIIAVPVSVGKNKEQRAKLFKIWEILKKPYIITTQKLLSDFESYETENALDTTTSAMRERSILIGNAEKPEASGTIFMAEPEDIAFIQFSSGSTGEPKGVVLTHNNLIVNIYAMCKGYKITDTDIMLSWMPLTHDMGLIGFHLLPVVSNINQFIMPTTLFIRHPTLWIKSAVKHKATILGSPNFGYNYFLRDYKPEIALNWDLSNVRVIANGAEPISTELCNYFLNEMGKYKLSRNCMLTVYGMAEASVCVTVPPVGEGFVSVKVKREALNFGEAVVELEEGEGSEGVTFVEVGYPISDCYVRICDDNDSIVAEHAIGHIQISGGNVTSGYYNNPQASALVKTGDGWLRTGDLGFMRKGQLVVTGRMKDVIFVNGQSYYPHDIERGVEDISHFGLNEVAACSVYNEEQHKENIFIYVLYKKSMEQFIPLALKIKNLIMQRIGLEICEVIPIRKIPKTTSGKIQRYKLRQSQLTGEYQHVINEIRELTESYAIDTTDLVK